jgi:putative ABC transport system permease protein
MKAVEQTANLSLTLASVVLVAGCAGVMNTMASSVHQRRREIGVLISLGAEDIYIYRIFLYESIILGVIGGLIGLGLGIASSMLLGPLLLQVPIQTRDIQIFSIPLSVGISVASCFVASLYPTWRAAKVDPVSALKAI